MTLAQRLISFRRFHEDTSGLALVEFALTLPILLLMGITGAELTNYITVKMRVSQLALQIADNAARIGAGSQLQAKTITEADINDLLIGAGIQASELDLYGKGRVIVSSLEPDPSHAGKYRVRWQRCRGSKTSWASHYGLAGANNLSGMGEPGRLVTAPVDGATMFVEVYYEYTPLIPLVDSVYADEPSTHFKEIASMAVRDRRDLAGGTNGVYQVSGVTPSTC